MNGQTLYVFIDESGNFDFTPSGTRYFVLTAVSTLVPLKSRRGFLGKVYELKYTGWSQGQPDYYFHAAEDRQGIRDFVFRTIGRLDDIEVDAVIAQKNKTNPTLYIRYSAKRSAQGDFSFKTVRSEERFYDTISRILLRYVFNRHRDGDRVGRIVVILGSVFTEAKRGYVLKSLKRHLKRDFRKPFYIYFRPTSSDINCQVADYCGWAVYVRAERGEERPWREISNMVRSHFDVFARGTEEYY